MNRALVAIGVFLITLYRATLSPLFGATCRYTPSCSHYTEQALRRFGPWRGTWMGLRRIARCHPWHAGGYDPVPQRDAAARTSHREDPTSSSESPSTTTDVLRSVSRI